MISIQVLRAIWTAGFGVGTVAMLLLLRESLIDAWALSQNPRDGIALYWLTTEGEVWDPALLSMSMAAFFLAGVMSYTAQAAVVIPLLIIGGLPLVTLGILKHVRRRRVFTQLRMLRRRQRSRA